MKLRVLLFLISIVHSYLIYAQNPNDLIYVSFESTESAELTAALPDTSLRPELAWNRFSVHLIGPILYRSKDTSTLILTKLQYNHLEFTYPKEGEADVNRVTTLYNPGIQFLYIKRITQTKLLTAYFLPMLATDFKNFFETDDFKFAAGFYYFPNVTKRFKVGYGLVSTLAFGESLIFPIVSLNYRNKANNFITELLFPRLTLKRKFGTGKLNIGLEAAISGSEFNVADDNDNQTNVFTNELDYVRFTQTNVGPFIGYNFYKNFHLRVFGGAAVNKQFQLFNSKNKELQGGLLDTENGLFVNVNISLRIGS